MIKRSEISEEIHMLPMRVLFQTEGDGVVMQLSHFPKLPITTVGRDKKQAISLMHVALSKQLKRGAGE